MVMIILIGANGAGVRHWRQWIAISIIFVAIGANGENSKSFTEIFVTNFFTDGIIQKISLTTNLTFRGIDVGSSAVACGFGMH